MRLTIDNAPAHFLNLVCTLTDRTRPVVEGRIKVGDFDLNITPGEPEDMFRMTTDPAVMMTPRHRLNLTRVNS